ncbi:JAB domain-containing protein [Alkalihalobacterium sp. APHAB7]|uniref:JAB domain-containing protein n=1 Tax=Alkalihalobacterium sp. APHAB7 TaxID=3402081 RepID=UPI003AAF4D41
MKLETIFEVVKIKQDIREIQAPFASYSIRSPHDAAELAKSYIADEDREVFLVMCLNTKNKVIGLHKAHVGSLNSCVIHPREIFKAAILNNACSIVVSHQHPSGDTVASREDLEVTKNLVEAGKILGIEVLDHLIVSPTEAFNSLKSNGYM